MNSPWRDSIYQWLSKATESAEPLPAPDAHHPPPVDPTKHFDSFPADLEVPSAAQGSTTSKRMRGADREDALKHHPPKKTRNEYERRPRHKTHEDRYDYKPNGTHGKGQSRKGKKRLRRGRKETMNDGFHASNVPRERLTLRKNANIGIFSKGKASSPIKHRDVPEHAFSETHFLSRKTPRNRRESVTIDVNELKDRGQKERTPYDFAPPRAERSVGPPQMMHKDKSPQRMAESDSVPHPLPHARTSGPDARHEEDEAQSVAQPLLPQGGTSKLESGSATPYSWSESESSITRLERAVDLRLLEILHTGLSSTQISNAEKSKHSQRDYCDLQGLKALLNDRKAHWETKDRLSNSSCFREKLVEASAPSERAADIQPSLTSGVISSGEPGLLLNQSPPDPQFPRPRDCDDHGRTVTINRPDQIGQLSQHHDEMDMMEIEENDEAFFHKLDAAFHEIMGPECKAIEPIRGRQRGKRTSLHRKSMPSLLSDQVGSEIPPLVPSPIIWQSTEKLATRSAGHHESREFVNRSSNEGCPEQNVEDQYLAGLLKQPLSGSTQPAGYGARTVPKGFWRQNKLY